MTLAITVLAIATFLAGATIGILAVFVAGIRTDDRAKNLTNAPRTHVASRDPPGARSRRPQRPRRPQRARGGVTDNAELHDQHSFALLPMRRALREHQIPLPQMQRPRSLVPA